MKKKTNKKLIKVDRIDSYIVRYRENLKLQDELEKKRKETAFEAMLKKDFNEIIKKR